MFTACLGRLSGLKNLLGEVNVTRLLLLGSNFVFHYAFISFRIWEDGTLLVKVCYQFQSHDLGRSAISG